jgi:dTDP-4-amino-4,6-dideoxygalactose transaminase
MKKPDLIDGLKSCLDMAGIAWKRNFGCMATQHRCFEYLGHKLGDFPNAEYIGDNGIHIGVHKLLTEDNLQHIKSSIYGFFFNLRNNNL